MKILGVDPGGTTGLVVLDLDIPAVIDYHQFNQEETVVYLYMLLTNELEYTVDAVAIERFTIAGRTLTRSRQTTALEIIGVTKALCQLSETPLHLQTPADAKNVWSDERLKTAGISITGKHCRDALRHALLLAQRHGTMVSTAENGGHDQDKKEV